MRNTATVCVIVIQNYKILSHRNIRREVRTLFAFIQSRVDYFSSDDTPCELRNTATGRFNLGDREANEGQESLRKVKKGQKMSTRLRKAEEN